MFLISNFRRVLNVVCFFSVILRLLNFICRRFGTLCLFHLHRQVGVKNCSHLPACGDRTECSETSVYKIQKPGNYPEKSIQYLIVVSIFQFFENLGGVLLFMAHSEKLIVPPALKLGSKLLAKNLPYCKGSLFLPDNIACHFCLHACGITVADSRPPTRATK